MFTTVASVRTHASLDQKPHSMLSLKSRGLLRGSSTGSWW